MAFNWDNEYEALQFAIVKNEDDYGKIKIEGPQDLGDFRQLEFHITFDAENKELRVRAKKDNDLYGFNRVIKGLIKTANLSGGLKKEKNHAILRIEKDLKEGGFSLHN